MAKEKRLIDAKPLMQNGWHLVRTGESNKFLASMSLADVPTVDAVEVASTWIPTATQKPKKNGEYIVWIVGASQATSLWYDPEEDEWFGSDDSGVIYPVSHWMPLPELPKEAKGGDKDA